MKTKNMSKISIALSVSLIVWLIVVNLFKFDPITLNYLRIPGIAIIITQCVILRMINRAINTQKTES